MSFLFTELLHHLSPHYVDYYYFYSRSTTAAVSKPLERIWNFCFSQRLLENLEDEIFLKGGSIVTPQKFNQVLVINPPPLNCCIIYPLTTWIIIILFHATPRQQSHNRSNAYGTFVFHNGS